VLFLVRRFFALSALQVVIGTVTGIIAARSLGPSGRGELAAIIVPLSLLPYPLSFGLTTFASRSAAAGRDLGLVLGTAGALAFVIGCAAVAPCLVLATVLAEGSRGVYTVLVIGFSLLPISLVANVLADVGLGRQAWNRVTIQRLIPMLTVLLGYVLLLLFGVFTPASAGAVVLASGFLSAIPFLPIASRARPLRFSPAVAREALRFGTRAMPITLSQLLNHRLDQLLMVPLVSRRQLGLYAVAVTISGIAGMLASAMHTVLYPKVAAGEDISIAGALRRGLFAVACLSLLLAVVSPIFLPVAFGRAFGDAVPMALILLVAAVPLAGVTILSAVFTAGRRILLAGMSEIVSLGVTVIGLLLLLPSLGGIGAAIVSLVAYTVNFCWLLAIARRDYGGHIGDYLVIRRAELSELPGRARRLVTIARGAPARQAP
jgi:O-antigen/teichoic acid export membrane protein